MKCLSKVLSLIAAIAVISSALSSFSSSKKILRSDGSSYAINLVSIETINGNNCVDLDINKYQSW
jgi:hypothetical protein